MEQVFKFLQLEPSICDDDLVPSPDVLVFLDGVLNLKTGTFSLHTPDIFSTGYLNASYKSGKRKSCPCFDQFVADIADNDPLLVQRIWVAVGYTLTQDYRAKVFILFQGVPDSGKSVLGNFIRGCINPEGSTSLDLHSFGKNFALADIVGKRLCIDLDLPGGIINERAASFLKKMTGGDLLSTDVKYMPRVSFVNTAKLLFGTNHAIFTPIDDSAFSRRIVVIPFTKSIPQSEQDLNLLASLEAERDAVVVKALSAYYKLRDNQYIFSGDFKVNDTIADGEKLCDEILQFFNQDCEEQVDTWTPTDVFYEKFIEKYGEICAKNIFSETFWTVVKAVLPSVEKRRGRVNGKGNPVYGYLGIRLR